jgi:hypothetical protein
MATRAGINAFVRTYSDPAGEQTRNAFTTRQGDYATWWAYYNNSVFEDLARWGSYKGRYHLYRGIRSIYNPTRRLVDFYAANVYPGILTTDAERLPDGTPLAIPLAEDVPPALLNAIGQLWQWSNWQNGKGLLVRYGAAVGDVFAHVVDDVESGKVYPEILWPGLIAALELDSRGNVQMYAIEFDYNDNDGQKHTYRREVDKQSIRTLRDNKPFEFDEVPATIPNVYGFVPAIWCKHSDIGGDHGQPAMRNQSKFDELNSLASHTYDQAHRIMKAPIIISGSGIQRLAADQVKRGATADFDNPAADRESLDFLQGDDGATATTIQLPTGEALAHIKELLAEIKEDHPELGMYQQLRSMTQVTGPGANRLFGDVEGYVNDARANYDVQSVKLFQMSIAIGGFRANTGAWGPALTRQQEAFRPFGLDSYAAGDLDFEIQPRSLIPMSALERMQVEQMSQSLDAQRQIMSGDGMLALQTQQANDGADEEPATDAAKSTASN